MVAYFRHLACASCLCECVCVSCVRLTAPVYHRRAGWQGDLLELWRNYGNRRLVYPGLCQVENKTLTCLLSCKQLFVTEAASAKLTITTVCAGGEQQ